MKRLLAPAALVAALASASPALAAAVLGTWQVAGQTATPHRGQTATLLYDGRVLVVGGTTGDNENTPGGVELFEPGSGRWTAGAPTSVPRTGHFAVRLDDGRVLVGGGYLVARSGPITVLASTETFDFHTKAWTAAAPMSAPRAEATATLLPDGRVLVAGGTAGGDQATATAELYDPRANSWTSISAMRQGRLQAAAALLRTGDVLVAGGARTAANQDGSLDTAELFDYRTGGWKPTGPMAAGAALPAIGVLDDGSAILAGGILYQGGYPVPIGAVQVYQPAANAWAIGPSLQQARGGAGGATLTNGDFLVVGGRSRVNGVASQVSAELYRPSTRAWVVLPRLRLARLSPTVTPLRGGRALVVGGASTGLAEMFVPTPPAAFGAPATIPAALAANRLLLAVTGALLLLVLFQLGWRRRPQVGGGR